MLTTILGYTVYVTYESEGVLDEGDQEALRAELESTLHNANTMGQLDPPDRAIQAFTLEVKGEISPC